MAQPNGRLTHDAVESATQPVASEAMVFACFDALLAHFDGKAAHGDGPPRYPDAHWCVMSMQWFGAKMSRALTPALSPFFVTWTRTQDARLRGCIGSLEARGIADGLPEYALTSALRDRRFPPVTRAEVAGLECTVSLLTHYESAASWQDWEVGTHGLIIDFTDPSTGMRRSATYLPEIAAREGWSRRYTVESLLRKAGYDGAVSTKLLASLIVTRYQSSPLTRAYADYAEFAEARRRNALNAAKQAAADRAPA